VSNLNDGYLAGQTIDDLIDVLQATG